MKKNISLKCNFKTKFSIMKKKNKTPYTSDVHIFPNTLTLYSEPIRMSENIYTFFFFLWQLLHHTTINFYFRCTSTETFSFSFIKHIYLPDVFKQTLFHKAKTYSKYTIIFGPMSYFMIVVGKHNITVSLIFVVLTEFLQFFWLTF